MKILKCQSIILGIGEMGEQVAQHYLDEYGEGSSEDINREDSSTFIVLSHCTKRSGKIDRSPDRLWSSSENKLLENIATAFEKLLGDRPVKNFGYSYYLDVFVCGAWRDEDFRFYLPLVLPFIERLAHERYSSIFSFRDDLCNARLFIHPVALSVNMPREPSRKIIARQLANIEAWHTNLQKEGRPAIPRFFLYDGFTNNIQLNDVEIVGITSHFIGLCTRGGIRADSEFRLLLNFSKYGEDFFCVLSLATIQFTRKYFHQKALSLIVEDLYSQMARVPEGRNVGQPAQQAEILGISRIIQDEIIDSNTLRNVTGRERYRDTIHEMLFHYKGRISATTPALEERLFEIFASGQTFPLEPYRYPPETLERYFDRKWLEHLIDSCYPPPGQDVALDFHKKARLLRDICNSELKRIMGMLDNELVDLLETGKAGYSLNTFCAALRTCEETIIRQARRLLDSEEEKLPQRRWRFAIVRDMWARLRGQIWNYIPGYAFRIWIPLMAVFSTLQLLAIFRLWKTFVDPSTEGARLLESFNEHPMLFPALLIVSFIICFPLLGLYHLYTRRRLKKYLDTTPSESSRIMEEVMEDDAPELVGGVDYMGVFPAAGSLMARKTGSWWYKHEELGSLSLIQGLLKFVEIRVRKARETAAKVLERIEDKLKMLHEDRELEVERNLYFNDYLVDPQDAEQFAIQINKSLSIRISAQNVAYRLCRDGVDSFLNEVADFDRVLSEAEREIPFFKDCSVFSLPSQEEKLLLSLGKFLTGLSDRLSHGQIFHFLTSQEQDKLIEDTKIFLVCPQEALSFIQTLESRAMASFKKIISSEKDHIWGLRIIRDISIQSILRYMYPDHSNDEIDDFMEEWIKSSDETFEDIKPWDELRV
ncbi:MAG: hypothetical protein KOO63_12555 [Bacteroidales bacterium]|nr:hypothetical protein [Candidatus Latescibacterota bacterium]